MNLLENIKLALEGLRANKMRAFLTMLGIIIGISSVVTISSLGDTLTNSVTDVFANIGGNNIQVYTGPKDMESGVYYYEPISQEMKDKYTAHYQDKIEGISFSTSVGAATTRTAGPKQNLKIEGINEDYLAVDNIKLLRGRTVAARDLDGEKKVAVISNITAAALFGEQNPIGLEIPVELESGPQTFRVIGVYEDPNAAISDSIMGAMMGNTQTPVYIPFTTAKALNGNTDEGYDYLMVKAKSGVDTPSFAAETADYLNSIYKSETNVIYAESMQSMISQMTQIMSMLSLGIAIIAGISLLVGGIGVMNIMLVSVTERTREIGIRKALGAPNSAIRIQFIVESIIICIIGGIIGILCSAGLGLIAGAILKEPVVPSPSSILIAVLFSTAIGIFFGYYPANKAAKLNPIDALRYE